MDRNESNLAYLGDWCLLVSTEGTVLGLGRICSLLSTIPGFDMGSVHKESAWKLKVSSAFELNNLDFGLIMELEGKLRKSRPNTKNNKILSSFENHEEHYVITVQTS